uniref:Major facilitator superfamily (MFS) profile domain-containing protein n=1 Tax=Entomoneis paludosa TaxID=265537 RepID=A0A7S2YM00_9STRA
MVPLVLWVNDKGAVADSIEGVSLSQPGYRSLTWAALFYLAALVAIYRLMFSVSVASLMLAMNRTVIPSHRATMNGVATLLVSLARSVGPGIAGFLVAFSLSAGVFQPLVGATCLFLFLAMADLAAGLSAIVFLREEIDQERDSTIQK